MNDRHRLAAGPLKRADIHVGQWRSGGGGGTSGPSFPRPRSPHPLLPSFCSGEKTAAQCRRRPTRCCRKHPRSSPSCFKETAYERRLT
jgi:hypothetical protein